MSLKDVLDLLLSAFRFAENQRNPVRQQASRVLRAFEAHGISRTQINRVLPNSLRLPSMKWANPDELKECLTQEHLEWIQNFFALERAWIEGEGNEGNQEIGCYKTPQKLNSWLEANKNREEGLNFRLYLITGFDGPYDVHRKGDFALVLEQLIDVDEHESTSRFYHLSPGAHFSHPSSVLHLSQVLAVAYHHGAMMRRLKLKPHDAYRLSQNEGLIAEWICAAQPQAIEADHEFWEHFSGAEPSLVALREEAESSLEEAGLKALVTEIREDRERFMRRGTAG
ncbi:hypothetical protein [Pseudomonas aeruginosa]|uniref:hypothetical protein n=1 Tax=Pseudomonas aeruginosa TaxID=287 RepID=UPI000F51D622|nr:hypothetical protein [Pseudomonas aeruginosa]RPV98684.1 hypothetical protein IPC776_25220 [Pseudomonas aeruginosa]WCW08876.1 hypothetical protein KK222_04970 [Pseudomonas aeruginosa]